MATIPRNHTRKIATIKVVATTCRIFNQYDDFAGPACSPDAAWEALQTYDFARLTTEREGRWTVQVHSNLWYELASA